MQPFITLTQLFLFFFFYWGIRQLAYVHLQLDKQERYHFQSHYDWTAVLVRTFQNQQSLPRQLLTATAGCRRHSGAAIPHS